jgi:phosphoribosyl-ATP pyrophosphohydrolase/phosphoribosyl-AMP cyclohydrolase
MNKFNPTKLNFSKLNGLIPAVIQDADSKAVLMVGFMNEEALKKTITDKKVTFWSRTKKRLWQKGEESGNYLNVESISSDCDNDSLLIMAKPVGPTCHTGESSCFEGVKKENLGFLKILFDLIKDRKEKMPESSYTTQLFSEGLGKILAKVEEESDEVINAAKNETKQRLSEESGDLLYHLFVLLVEKGIDIEDLIKVLIKRHNK